ncbi:hypothetical protein HDU86_005978 [Geranomyces michiganensis]|nr:hypothetical protein HDU86_005978 [Geranomyces michiganensis]
MTEPEAAAFVTAKRRQLEQLLETHAAALSLDSANVHLSYNDPITPEELPAFTWLAILFSCSKERCLDPAKGHEGRFPSPVWDWLNALASELEPSDSAARARAVFAELRTVSVSWIGRVGLRRALSLWDLFCWDWDGDEAFFKQTVLRSMSDVDTRRWLLDTVHICGPSPDSFPYPEEVRLDIVHSNQPSNDSKDVESRRRLQLFQPFTHGSETKTWIAHEPYPRQPYRSYYRQSYAPYQGYDIGSQEMFFVLPIAVAWAIEAALLVRHNGTSEVVPLPRGRFPFPPNKWFRGSYRIAEPPFRAQCIMIEKKNPLVCQVCSSTDNSSLNGRERLRMWAMRVTSEEDELENNPHSFLRYCL